MKKGVFFILIIFLAGLTGFRLYQELTVQKASAGRPGFGGPRAALLVDTAEVEPHLFQSTLELPGELEARASVQVMSRINGRLQSVLVDRGDLVEQGQLLAVVEDDDLQQQVRRARAVRQVTVAALNREKTTYENLKKQADRYAELYELGIIAAQEYENRQSEVEVAKANVELAQAELEQSEAAIGELEIQLQQTRIYSPLTGFVGMRHLDPGAMAAANTAIVTVLDISRVKTIVSVIESALSELRSGLPATVLVDAFPGRSFSGQVNRISPQVDPETRSAAVEVQIANPDLLLKPGMFARVKIAVRYSERALTIPRSSLLTRRNTQGVFQISDEMTAVFRPIRIGRIEDDLVEVVEGLEQGEQVVATGAQNLNEGDRITLE